MRNVVVSVSQDVIGMSVAVIAAIDNADLERERR